MDERLAKPVYDSYDVPLGEVDNSNTEPYTNPRLPLVVDGNNPGVFNTKSITKQRAATPEQQAIEVLHSQDNDELKTVLDPVSNKRATIDTITGKVKIEQSQSDSISKQENAEKQIRNTILQLDNQVRTKQNRLFGNSEQLNEQLSSNSLELGSGVAYKMKNRPIKLEESALYQINPELATKTLAKFNAVKNGWRRQVSISKIDQTTVEYYKKNFGIDLGVGGDLILTGRAYNHLVNEGYYSPDGRPTKDNMPLTDADIADLPLVFGRPDRANFETNTDGKIQRGYYGNKLTVEKMLDHNNTLTAELTTDGQNAYITTYVNRQRWISRFDQKSRALPKQDSSPALSDITNEPLSLRNVQNGRTGAYADNIPHLDENIKYKIGPLDPKYDVTKDSPVIHNTSYNYFGTPREYINIGGGYSITKIPMAVLNDIYKAAEYGTTFRAFSADRINKDREFKSEKWLNRYGLGFNHGDGTLKVVDPDLVKEKAMPTPWNPNYDAILAERRAKDNTKSITKQRAATPEQQAIEVLHTQDNDELKTVLDPVINNQAETKFDEYNTMAEQEREAINRYEQQQDQQATDNFLAKDNSLKKQIMQTDIMEKHRDVMKTASSESLEYYHKLRNELKRIGQNLGHSKNTANAEDIAKFSREYAQKMREIDGFVKKDAHNQEIQSLERMVVKKLPDYQEEIAQTGNISMFKELDRLVYHELAAPLNNYSDLVSQVERLTGFV